MARFDFVTGADFRASLDRDYAEMTHALQGDAWKAVQVLSGSIVETLLVDYLVSTTVVGRPAKDPLTMSLSEVVAICKSEKVLSERAADLCSVIRSYRNLIHPGRAIRLKEEAPNKDSANIASTLVNMIADEVGKARATKLGMTGAQIVSKVIRDSNAISIVPHLLAETSETERSNMLLDQIPAAHKAVMRESEDDEFETLVESRLSKAFALTFSASEPGTRALVAKAFVKMIKEGDSQDAEWYRRSFFSPDVFEAIEIAQRRFVLDYLFGKIDSLLTRESVQYLTGLEKYFSEADIKRWVDFFVRTATYTGTKEPLRDYLIKYFAAAYGRTQAKADLAIRDRLKYWMKQQSMKLEVKQATLKLLLEMYEELL